MKPPLIVFKSGYFPRWEWNGCLNPWILAGILCFLMALASGCAVNRISEGTYVHEPKGYSFHLPGANWEVDDDAWAHEREFGTVEVKKPFSKFELRNNRKRNDPNEEIEFERRRPITVEKQIMDMDIGFQHINGRMGILVGTISARDLVKFLKGKFVQTDSDLPDNLIETYMKRFQAFYPSQQPASVTSKNLAQAGTAIRLQWDDGRKHRMLYGIELTREYLFVLLKADNGIPASDLHEGIQALDQLVDKFVRLKYN